MWEKTSGTLPPKGPYASVALGPYDNKTYGAVTTDDRTGWSTDNALQFNYQRLYRRGYAYQIFYVYSRAMRVGGDRYVSEWDRLSLRRLRSWSRPDIGSRRAEYFQNYQIDSGGPEHHISFNGIVDLRSDVESGSFATRTALSMN